MRPSVLLSLLPFAAASPTQRRAEPAPLRIPTTEASNLIADKYIVKFRKDSPLAVLHDVVKGLKSDPHQVFENAFAGFAGKLDKAALEALRFHPDVDYIEQDHLVTASGFVTQNNVPWGLGRISHRQVGSGQYVYDDSAGQGTCAYIIDSGLDGSHPDFEGRARLVRSFVPNSQADTCGHGTHVAGTIGSKTFGVAKKTQLYGIKVLDYDRNSGRCTGSNSGIISGMEYVATDARNRNCPNGVVVNMSLGGDYSQALNDAADALTQQGFFVAVAAGNDNKDASYVSPASARYVCTVGGTARDDYRYTGSNYGPVVNILGPAVDVYSTLPGGGSGRMTGTSMATPHIAGLAAYLAALEGKPASPDLCRRMQDMATRGAIGGQPRNTVNLLAFNGNPSG
ncbi:proteinase T-like protein [Purpureocillium lavendulum]|uniref:Proteinase T-like protein n=1 Tax=Purpureocillium lavendulum TaxID=1247861 RepID=A0AB34FTE9_9HYPO|nr:proteinase T-like protein [Purpureocillium lavendulum]